MGELISLHYFKCYFTCTKSKLG